MKNFILLIASLSLFSCSSQSDSIYTEDEISSHLRAKNRAVKSYQAQLLVAIKSNLKKEDLKGMPSIAEPY